MTLTVDTGDAAGVCQIMEPLLSALINAVLGGEGEGGDEGGREGHHEPLVLLCLKVLVGGEGGAVLIGVEAVSSSGSPSVPRRPRRTCWSLF